MPKTALSLLQHGEICVIVFHDGKQVEAIWSTEDRCFHIPGEDEPVQPGEVYEWWPAGVKF